MFNHVVLILYTMLLLQEIDLVHMKISNLAALKLERFKQLEVSKNASILYMS